MPNERNDAGFQNLIRYIQESRGIDFRGYKSTSLRRRIALRMEHVGAEDYEAYHDFLEAHPQEFADLLNTILINVTSFFRDPDAWKLLMTEIVPRMTGTDRHENIRIWSIGCASGEEPYSLAILFAEAMGLTEFSQRVKIYATDLDEPALNVARRATYQQRDVEQLPADLLQKYFEHTGSQYGKSRTAEVCDLRPA